MICQVSYVNQEQVSNYPRNYAIIFTLFVSWNVFSGRFFLFVFFLTKLIHIYLNSQFAPYYFTFYKRRINDCEVQGYTNQIKHIL